MDRLKQNSVLSYFYTGHLEIQDVALILNALGLVATDV